MISVASDGRGFPSTCPPFVAADVNTPSNAGRWQCAPAGFASNPPNINIEEIVDPPNNFTPLEIVKIQTGILPNTVFQIGGSTAEFGSLDNRVELQLDSPELGWTGKQFYGYTVKEW